MTRRAREIAILNDYISEHLFPPAHNWPIYEFKRRSYCRWAANEIRYRMAKNRSTPVLIILEDFEKTCRKLSLAYGAVEADFRNPYSDSLGAAFGFDVACDTAEDIAALFL